MNDKAAVVKALRDMGLLLQIKGENAFKTRAYDLAAERIAGVSDDLAELVAKNRLTELQGIGDSMAKKITELVTTGKIAALEELRREFPPGVLELLKLQDLGPKKAKALVDALGVGSIDALEQACKEQKVRGLKGFGEKTEAKLLEAIALARRTQADPRKALADVLPLAALVLEKVRSAPGVQRASLGGSVRRMRETVADVDIIASAADPRPVFAAFTSHPKVAQVLGQGDSKASVRLHDHDLQIDLRVLPDEDFATALHHFTGSKAHHIRLRALAQEKGLKLSEWGLHEGEKKLLIRSEEEIYQRLGLQYVPPELREDQGEFEAAQKGEIPSDLIAIADIQGNVHSHSTWSDGKHSLEEMTQAAIALGMKYLTVTEHSQTAGYAGGLKEDDLKRQSDEVDALNEKYKSIRLLKGVESDILEDGRLDYPEKVLEKLDVVICSIHARHGQDENAMTQRVLTAIENPFFQIWGHPTGRLIQKREPAPMRMEEILDACAKRGVVVEVNGGPERLDLSADHVRLALQRGLKISASTDSHSIHELALNLPLAVGTARRGWARRKDVVNALSADGFLGALRKH